ncbi:MAG: peptidase domain-containing ABC transporter [Clostridia bacterium]
MQTKWRVPFIEQMEQSECGICCLAMVLAYYDSHVPLHDLRDRGGAGRDGTTLLTLKKIAHTYGLDSAGVKVSCDLLGTLQLPAILHWEDSHFVVLEKIGKKHVIIVDPAIGRRKLLFEEVSSKFSGVALQLQPNASFQKHRTKPIWTSYIKLLFKQPTLVATIIVWSLWLQMLALVSPLLIRYLIDEVILPQTRDFLHVILIMMVILAVTFLVIQFLRARMLVRLQNIMDWTLMSQFFFKLLKLPYQFFQLRTSGDLIVRANSNMAIRDILSTRTVTAILDGGLVLFFLLYMLNQSLLLTSWVVGVAIVQVAIMLASSRTIKRLSQEQILKQTASTSVLLETLRGIHVVKAEGVEQLSYDRWQSLYQEQLAAMKRRGYAEAHVESILAGLRFAAPLLLLYAGVEQVLSYHMTLGEMLAFYTLAIAFLTPLTSLVQTLTQMIVLGAYLNRILDIHDAKPEQDDARVAPPPPLQGRIELNKVSFRYTEHSPLVIRNVSLQIQPGQKVAIVGKSGAGKSTLASLLLGLYQPTEGEILFDGMDLATLDKPAMRQQLGVVMQNTFIFNRSIAENIALHNHKLTFAQLQEVARMAGIHEDIMEMPMKYHTMLSETGSNISGGQRQRLALARALAHQPKILLLDEATSALDNLTEQIVDDSLSRLHCTRIVIAHRLSTVMNADVILVMHNGEVVEQGTHEELLRLGGTYASIYKGKKNKHEMTVEVG